MEDGSPLQQVRRSKRLAIVALFTSFGTLLCCALPVTLVALGFGSVVAALVSSVPLLAPLSAHKAWLFAASGVFILAGGFALRAAPTCPSDQESARQCANGRAMANMLLQISALIWSVGLFFAYLLLPLFELIGVNP